MSNVIYLDNHATTRLDPRVLDAMMPYLTNQYGNPASRQHAYGWRAEAAVEWARGQVAALIGAQPRDIVFTSGATESINLALKGAVAAGDSSKNEIITTRTEHRAALDTCAALEEQGARIVYVDVNRYGGVDPVAVERAITAQTLMVSIMMANNEIGTLAPIEDIGAICREHRVLLHSDAAQMVGHLPVNVESLQVDLLTCSAHKMHGPKGCGVLYVRNGAAAGILRPLIDGGGHERGLRAGSLNVPAIVGFGRAAQIAAEEMSGVEPHVRALRNALVTGITASLEGVTSNGDPVSRLPHNASLTFRGARADAIMMKMKDVAVSSGSACSTNDPQPSHVLKAIGLGEEEVRSTLRFGLSKFSTDEEITMAIRRVTQAVTAVRRGSIHEEDFSYEHAPH